MGDSNSRWSLAQQREQHYYETRAASHGGADQVDAEFHLPLWRGILDRLPELVFATMAPMWMSAVAPTRSWGSSSEVLGSESIR
jgi:hypothetical protein